MSAFTNLYKLVQSHGLNMSLFRYKLYIKRVTVLLKLSIFEIVRIRQCASFHKPPLRSLATTIAFKSRQSTGQVLQFERTGTRFFVQ